MGPGIVNPRRKVIALILSGVFLGLGQLYNRQLLKGTMFLTAGRRAQLALGRDDPDRSDGASPCRSCSGRLAPCLVGNLALVARGRLARGRTVSKHGSQADNSAVGAGRADEVIQQ